MRYSIVYLRMARQMLLMSAAEPFIERSVQFSAIQYGVCCGARNRIRLSCAVLDFQQR